MDSNFKRYSQIIKKTPKEISIIAYLPVLKDVDYRRGFVKRYFKKLFGFTSKPQDCKTSVLFRRMLAIYTYSYI